MQQNRIKKSCQIKKSKRADRLRDLLQLTPSDSILLDACARKSYNDGKIWLISSGSNLLSIH
jgi:hypothetical protein